MTESELEKNRRRSRLAPGRATCERCRRPVPACWCAHVRPVETRTRLVLLQHPRERDVPIGTARMASLCLPRSELLVGVDWSRSETLRRALSDPERPPILLYPGDGAIDIVRNPPAGPVTLVVVDGTWSQARKVVRSNPVLASLPRYAFVPDRPSEYRIRKEPDDVSVATIEALVHALTALEGDGARFETLLAPFRAMIEFQLACEERFQAVRTRHAKRRARPRRLRVPRALTERTVVCVAAEANAWPHAARASDPARADELVHWAAHRPATGETFEFVVAPRRSLAPGTPGHTGLDEATLRAGGTVEELAAAWRSFIGDTDVFCSWGAYEPRLLLDAGGILPPPRLDLRLAARDFVGGSAGTLSGFRDRVVTTPPGPPLARGRAGRKLAALAEIVGALVAAATREA